PPSMAAQPLSGGRTWWAHLEFSSISLLPGRGASLHRAGAAPVDRRQAKVLAGQSSSEAWSRSRELLLLRSRTPANANSNRAPGFHILLVPNRRAGES